MQVFGAPISKAAGARGVYGYRYTPGVFSGCACADYDRGTFWDRDRIRRGSSGTVGQVRREKTRFSEETKFLIYDCRDMQDLVDYNLFGQMMRGDEHDEN